MTISATNGDTPNSLETSTYSAYIREELRAGPVCLDSFYPKISGALRV